MKNPVPLCVLKILSVYLVQDTWATKYQLFSI